MALDTVTTDLATTHEGPRSFVKLREQPTVADNLDAKRLELLKRRWSSLDDVVRPYNRQIEENIRMLSGQMWAVYHPPTGRYLDVSEWMSRDDLRFRRRPVINRLLPWFIITHARATESMPIITFAPGPDKLDADLAEILDISHKALWREMGMVSNHSAMMAWLVAAGRGHLVSRIDANKGQMREWVGTDLVPVVDLNDQPVDDGEGGQAFWEAEGVPFDKSGQPLAQWRIDPAVGPTYGELVKLGPPHKTPQGTLAVDVLSPLQVRGEWSPAPWHKKSYHITKSYMTPEQVFDQYGVDVAPDVRSGQISDSGELERLLFGVGFYGAASGDPALQGNTAKTDGYCEVTCLWEAPKPYGGMEEEGDSAGGRLLCGTRSTVIHDGVRPAKFRYTSPIRTFEFIHIPGRQGGTTPLESMIPLNKQINTGVAHIAEHVALCTDPKAVIDSATGIQAGQFTNKPGQNYIVARRPGVHAIEFVAPPPLGPDPYKQLQFLFEQLEIIGNLRGTEGDIPSPSASGELIEQLRFNSDRFLGPTMRSSAEEYARLDEDWLALLPIVWDEETIISYAGEDNVARTLTVLPQMFTQGKVNVVPDMESMLPDGRGERHNRIYKMYLDGLFGPPGTPEASKKFFQHSHFPHMGRLAKWGGIDRITAEQEMGQLIRGEDVGMIPVYEWYDHEVHVAVLEEFMKSPEYKKLPPEIQAGMIYHRKAHLMVLAIKMQNAIMQQAEQQAMLAPGGSSPKGGPAPKSPPGPGGGPPAPPRGGVPGGVMPTAAGAPAPA